MTSSLALRARVAWRAVPTPLVPRHLAGCAVAGWLALGLVGATSAPAAVFRVGDGTGCTGTTLPVAILGALFNGVEADSILLTGTGQVLGNAYTLNLEVMGNLQIVGGFANCTDPLPGSGQTSISTPDSDGFIVQGGTSGDRFFTLKGVNWTGGVGAGRILALSQRLVAFLEHTRISSGYSADNGGNIHMTGPNVILSIDGGSLVSSGSAVKGAGIFCNGGGTIGLLDGKVYQNVALGDGGGLYLDACTLNDFAGQATPGDCLSAPRGILCNSADNGAGGGIFAANGASVNLIGGPAAPAAIWWNQAVQGGGIYATDTGTAVDATDTYFFDNSAEDLGGGIAVRQGASFQMVSDSRTCGGLAPCSRFVSNHAILGTSLGGAIAVDTGGRASVFQTLFTANSAFVTGSVAYVDGDRSTMLCEGCLVWGHYRPDNEAFFETDHSGLLKVAFSTIDEDAGCCAGLFDTNNSSAVEVYSSILMAKAAVGLGLIFEDAIGAGERRVADCILREESTPTLPPPADPPSYETIVDASTLFANLAGRDYHLRLGSQAEDFCDQFNYAPVRQDSDLEARGLDDPEFANGPFGPFDLGFDEYYSLFSDPFESGSCSQWSSSSGGC